jgi:GTP-binding protein
MPRLRLGQDKQGVDVFKDEITVRVKAGDGGDGIIAFLREPRKPKGGPSGGDGGRGGDVVVEADQNFNTLYHLTHQLKWAAESGGDGEGKNCSGKGGRSLVIKVPVGTLIRDLQRNAVLKDLSKHGESIVLCKGGKGGRGNQHFATPTRQVPRICEEGKPGEERHVRFELKMIADVGLVGMPNAGKSTLLSRLSAARPRIADYPFTTIIPNLGFLKLDDVTSCVIADLPGLIEGAHEGKGLGDQFLKHTERTRIIVHIVDVGPDALKPAAEAYRIIRKELESYSKVLAEKPEIVVANKVELTGAKKGVKALEKACGAKVMEISAATGKGLKELVREIFARLAETR